MENEYIVMEQAAWERQQHASVDQKEELSQLTLIQLASILEGDLAFTEPTTIAEAYIAMDQQTRKTQARSIIADRITGASGTRLFNSLRDMLPPSFKKKHGSTELKTNGLEKHDKNPYPWSRIPLNAEWVYPFRQKPSKLPR